MSTVTCIYEKSSSRKIATSDETLVLLSQDIMEYPPSSILCQMLHKHLEKSEGNRSRYGKLQIFKYPLMPKICRSSTPKHLDVWRLGRVTLRADQKKISQHYTHSNKP